MQINIKATGIELTSAIRDYVEKRLQGVEKFLKSFDGAQTASVEVGKTTEHHKKGEFFVAEINVRAGNELFRAVSERSDLYTAIDDAKEEIVRVITSKKDKKQTLFKRGAISVKKMLKGMSKRNPFTSKYD